MSGFSLQAPKAPSLFTFLNFFSTEQDEYELVMQFKRELENTSEAQETEYDQLMRAYDAAQQNKAENSTLLGLFIALKAKDEHLKEEIFSRIEEETGWISNPAFPQSLLTSWKATINDYFGVRALFMKNRIEDLSKSTSQINPGTLDFGVQVLKEQVDAIGSEIEALKGVDTRLNILVQKVIPLDSKEKSFNALSKEDIEFLVDAQEKLISLFNKGEILKELEKIIQEKQKFFLDGPNREILDQTHIDLMQYYSNIQYLGLNQEMVVTPRATSATFATVAVFEDFFKNPTLLRLEKISKDAISKGGLVINAIQSLNALRKILSEKPLQEAVAHVIKSAQEIDVNAVLGGTPLSQVVQPVATMQDVMAQLSKSLDINSLTLENLQSMDFLKTLRLDQIVTVINYLSLENENISAVMNDQKKQNLMDGLITAGVAVTAAKLLDGWQNSEMGSIDQATNPLTTLSDCQAFKGSVQHKEFSTAVDFLKDTGVVMKSVLDASSETGSYWETGKAVQAYDDKWKAVKKVSRILEAVQSLAGWENNPKVKNLQKYITLGRIALAVMKVLDVLATPFKWVYQQLAGKGAPAPIATGEDERGEPKAVSKQVDALQNAHTLLDQTLTSTPEEPVLKRPVTFSAPTPSSVSREGVGVRVAQDQDAPQNKGRRLSEPPQP